jgi:hypothetical protein
VITGDVLDQVTVSPSTTRQIPQSHKGWNVFLMELCNILGKPIAQSAEFQLTTVIFFCLVYSSDIRMNKYLGCMAPCWSTKTVSVILPADAWVLFVFLMANCGLSHSFLRLVHSGDTIVRSSSGIQWEGFRCSLISCNRSQTCFCWIKIFSSRHRAGFYWIFISCNHHRESFSCNCPRVRFCWTSLIECTS